MRKWFGLVALLLAVMFVLPTHAQQGVPSIAAITDGNLWLYSLSGNKQQITTTGGYDDPFWNVDGSLLGFIGDSPSGGGRTLFVIECKTGEFRADIDKYTKLRKQLGLDATQFIICNPDLPDDQLAGLGKMYGLSFVNLQTLRSHLECVV